MKSKQLLSTVAAVALSVGAANADPLIFTFQDYPTFQTIMKGLFNPEGGQYTLVQFCTNVPSTIGTVTQWQILTLELDTLQRTGNLTSIAQMTTHSAPAGFTSSDYTGPGKTFLNVPCSLVGGVSSPLSITAGTIVTTPGSSQTVPTGNTLTINAGGDYAAFKYLSQQLGGTTYAMSCTETGLGFSTNVWSAYTIFSGASGTVRPIILAGSNALSSGNPQPPSFTADFPQAITSQSCFTVQ